MKNGLKKRYGLHTVISMIIGVVVGSGIFFKSPSVLRITGGVSAGILAWLIGGVIMLSCASVFAVLAAKYKKVNGIVDYAEAIVGPQYGYLVGWFFAVIYYPCMTGVVAYLSGRYLAGIFGWKEGSTCLHLGLACLIAVGLLNMLAPKISGHFQISVTVIKLLPILAIALLGLCRSLWSGSLAETWNGSFFSDETVGLPHSSLWAGIITTCFAYEGWIIATSVNSEIHRARRNLPKALVIGGGAVVAIYLFFFIGVFGGTDSFSAQYNFSDIYHHIFGNVGGRVLHIFMLVAALGTLNGLVMGCMRGFYALAIRGRGPLPRLFSKVNAKVDMPIYSCLAELLIAGICTVYFYKFDFVIGGTALGFLFDISELPIMTVYLLYLPIFLLFMKRGTQYRNFYRFVLPLLAIFGSIIVVISSAIKFLNAGLVPYFSASLIVILFGFLFYDNSAANRKIFLGK